MSEYQYYEFQAIDRPLGSADRDALRDLSSRAVITSRSFTNHYEWGDFKGDPDQLMDRWFDLHLYLANWGTHRLVIRVPAHAVDLDAVAAIVGDTDDLTIRRSGDNVVFSIARDELEQGEAFWGDEDNPDSRWLADMEPLRGDLLAGDLRLFYLLWLAAIDDDEENDQAREPLSGLGPLTDALATFAEFFEIDADLVTAAAERSGPTPASGASPEEIMHIIAALPEADRLDVLVRLAGGDPKVAEEFSWDIRRRLAATVGRTPANHDLRTAGELRARARAIREARERAAAEREIERQRRKREDETKARRVRLDAILRRGDAVWRDIESEIERRNASGYDRALDLLTALKALAHERATMRTFEQRLTGLRDRHARKGRFVERLDRLL